VNAERLEKSETPPPPPPPPRIFAWVELMTGNVRRSYKNLLTGFSVGFFSVFYQGVFAFCAEILLQKFFFNLIIIPLIVLLFLTCLLHTPVPDRFCYFPLSLEVNLPSLLAQLLYSRCVTRPFEASSHALLLSLLFCPPPTQFSPLRMRPFFFGFPFSFISIFFTRVWN